MRQSRSLSVISTAILLASFSVNQITAAADQPWSERAIGYHVDQSQLSGTLSKDQLLSLRARGQELFSAKFTSLDGVGRPLATQAIIPTKRKRAPQLAFNRISGPDANSCASCHNEPATGGAGSFSVNVFASEGFTSQGFDSADPQFSNERNTNHIFGAGVVELLAREMTQDLHKLRKMALVNARKSGEAQTIKLITKGVNFGQLTATSDGLVDLSQISGIDTDLVIRPFSQKGVMTSLRQFTINALNDHHGMQAVERFGQRWTGEDDFDGDGVSDEISAGDVSALVAFQAMLAPPAILRPANQTWQRAAERGNKLFDEINCSTCHIRALALHSLVFDDPGPLDAAGTLRRSDSDKSAAYDLANSDWAKTLPRRSDGAIMVPLFGDLKRHIIADAQVATLGNELLSQRFVERDEFITAELWGVASTSPYGHRGDMTTLDEIIKAHGGEARQSRDKYVALPDNQQQDIIAYLKTLIIKGDENE